MLNGGQLGLLHTHTEIGDLVFLIYHQLIAENENKDTTTPTEPKEEFATIVKDIKDIHIEIEETYTLSYVVKANPGLTVSSNDETIVTVENNGEQLIWGDDVYTLDKTYMERINALRKNEYGFYFGQAYSLCDITTDEFIFETYIFK